MADTKYMSLVVAYYEEEDSAEHTIEMLRTIDRPGALAVIECALMKVDAEGKLRIIQAANRRGVKRIARGAVIGGVLGVLFPPSVLAMTAVGTMAAAAWNHFRDQGFEKNLLKEIAENISPGGAAVAAIVEDQWMGHLEDALQGYELLQRYIFDAESLTGLSLFDTDSKADSKAHS